jgi:linoleoyl-CoA desaturase
MTDSDRVKFLKDVDREFVRTLQSRVNAYFSDNGISKHANVTMVFKTIIIVTAYLLPLILMLTGVITSPALILTCFLIMGVAIAGIGMAVMHDANHGAYSSDARVNAAVGYLLNLVGGSAENWKIQHNILHHTYTNIEGLDADIKTFPMLRFSPFAKRRGIHRWQHIYAWFFYVLMTVSWIFLKDFKQLYDYQKSGMTKSYSTGFLSVALRILLLKAAYITVTLALPIILVPVAWYVVVGGFFAMHFVGGLILGMVFQAAHIMEVCDFPLPDADGKMGDGWLVHQLRTTTNFAPDNHVVNWYVGGLNFQVEHHLFPRICHVHYPQIAPIVRETCREYGVPYNSIPTFTGAVLGHGSMLRELGRRDFAPA